MPWVGVNIGFARTTRGLHLLILMGLLLWIPMSAISLWAASEEDKRWSFNFNSTSVSDVLDELTRTTGVYIFCNHLSDDKTVKKRYENQTLDEIVKDLFKGQSIGLVWHHGEEGIDALDIWVIDGAVGQSPSFSRIERPVLPNPGLGFGRRVQRSLQKDDDSEEMEEAEDDGADFPSESSELNDESEEEDAASDDDSGKEPAAVGQNEPEDESDESIEEESPVPIKKPVIE
jgi:hypothetical protein